MQDCRAHLITQANLENVAIFLDPFTGFSGVLVAKLDKTAEDGKSGNLGKILDLGYVRLVEILNQEKTDCYQADS